MTIRTLLAIALVAGWFISPAWAGPKPAKVQKECPVQESSLDAREEAIAKAPACKQALEIMEACAYGAGGDTGLGAAVVEKCEAGFLSKLSKAQRRTYDSEIKRCNNKYRNESGTMYRSFEAFCRAQLAVRTEAKFGKPSRN
jgi:hypothetical protein